MTRTALYRFFDADDRLLYVGITDDIHRRWKHHAAVKTWWGDVARQTVEWHDSRPVAEAAERKAISQEKPVYNIRDARAPLSDLPTFWDYVQWATGHEGQAEIARRIGVDKTTVWRWKNNNTSADHSVAIRFARAYHRDVGEVLAAAGHITEEEAAVREIVVATDLSAMSTEEIAVELQALLDELAGRARR
jgi:transcriptional regulator with XRE-family HTH domain